MSFLFYYAYFPIDAAMGKQQEEKNRKLREKACQRSGDHHSSKTLQESDDGAESPRSPRVEQIYQPGAEPSPLTSNLRPPPGKIISPNEEKKAATPGKTILPQQEKKASTPGKTILPQKEKKAAKQKGKKEKKVNVKKSYTRDKRNALFPQSQPHIAGRVNLIVGF